MISNLSQVMPAAVTQTREAAPVVVSPSKSAAVEATVPEPVLASGNAGALSGGKDLQLAAAIEKLNSEVQNLNRNLEFSLDKDSGELVVKVVDAKTRELISQIPRQEALQLAHNIEQYLQEHHIGLVKTKA
jgi:uncharacterized FlaG/YvyC family protein